MRDFGYWLDCHRLNRLPLTEEEDKRLRLLEEAYSAGFEDGFSEASSLTEDDGPEASPAPPAR
jgi:hypothetical protein